MPVVDQGRDVVLSPGTYAYVLDANSGVVKVRVGPQAWTLDANARLVIWTGKRFKTVEQIDEAIQSWVVAAEGQYVVLTNPAADDSFPQETVPATKLEVGRRVVIQGPTTFPLWPGQSAEPLEGHSLASNQYLVAQVYEPDAAKENVAKTIAAPQASEGQAAKAVKPRDFTMGERIVIRGTEVSFYVPPTGIEVVPEASEGGKGKRYVRDAATLEQLEYAVLIDENGRKRYERGPAVVFPKPTERFVTESGERKFRAIELNPQSGLYIKITANHVHDGDKPLTVLRGGGMVEVAPKQELHEGDELFITGADTPIYFPTDWQSVITYGKQRKHYAVAIPAGEARYVLVKSRGRVERETGPQMFLPDPRDQVIVRRVLDDRAAGLWYPGNVEALVVNQQLRGEQAEAGAEYLETNLLNLASAASTFEAGSLARSYQPTSTYGGEQVRRHTSFTPPRTITLDTKYQGAPRISVWPGYAVLVMDPTGNRRVETGPTDILLEYHETLMALTLATGRPKGTGTPIQTVYLRTVNNAVGDKVTVETRDLVPVTLELSLRVNFEGDDHEKWFAVEDYITLLVEHVRSRLRNLAKRHEVQEFTQNTIDLIRDALLGESKDGQRSGLPFAENGMRLYDVEVLNVTIEESGVRDMLDRARAESLHGAIDLAQQRERTLRFEQSQSLERQQLIEQDRTREAMAATALAQIDRALDQALRQIEVERQSAEQRQKVGEATRIELKNQADHELAIVQARNQEALARASAETQMVIDRIRAITPQLAEAVRVAGDQKVTEALLAHLGPAALASGTTVAELWSRAFGDTPLGGVMGALSERPYAQVNGGSVIE